MEYPISHRSAVAIHIVWTTYRSWMPGDARGHWSPLFDIYGRLTRAGHRLNIGDEITRKVSAEAATGEPRRLDDREAEIVAACIGACLVGGPEVGTAGGTPAGVWHAYAAAIESQHVHLLLATGEEPISRFVGRVKGKSSSQIGRASGRPGQRVWTAGLWRVFLFDHTAVLAARDYIIRHNIRRGLPADPFDWVTPPEIRRQQNTIGVGKTAFIAVSPPSEPDVRICRIRLSG